MAKRKRTAMPPIPLEREVDAEAEKQRLVYEIRNRGVDVSIHAPDGVLTFRIAIARYEMEVDESTRGNELFAELVGVLLGR